MNDEVPMMPDHDSGWRRLFTVAEANALLPSLIPVLEALRARKADLDTVRTALANLTPAMRENGHGLETVELERRVHLLIREIGELARRITTHGVELKDLDQGLIDFPARRAGRVVYLCWRLGEEAIAWWHELDGGVRGRQPL
jgi:hypothetical protein